jgi:DNA-binding LytR/AlgR family response regulator
MHLKLDTWIGLLFCLVVLPLLLFIFPLEEWASWHASYVLVFILWLYGLYFLNRKLIAPLYSSGKWKPWTLFGLLFVEASVTFLMTLSRVAFPKDMEHLTRLEDWQQAVWLLFTVVSTFSMALGLLSEKIRLLEQQKAVFDKQEDTRNAVQNRAQDAVAGEHITVKSDYSDVDIPLSEIRYIESRNNYACFHLDHREDVLTQMTLKSLEELLPEGKFVRIHRSYLIPAYRIESRRADEVKLIGVDKPLPVGRAYKERLNS